MKFLGVKYLWEQDRIINATRTEKNVEPIRENLYSLIGRLTTGISTQATHLEKLADREIFGMVLSHLYGGMNMYDLEEQQMHNKSVTKSLDQLIVKGS